ncbi:MULTISPECIES: membrane protein [Streptomyces]|uniref:Membrane lipoprotein n=1 Tax=Streptomyces coelicolor (strain ATCC BAA-471 / A3(2) / M145) TaxID=100226 RepID=Q9Z547_STRCO|nr:MULTISPECIES: membrane protein [Streptomyces]WTC11949.1 hypothetical protein OHA15_30730 [Streptomyces anthocyanicus]MDX2926553.1 hypothetical protein [Streptomyces sp. NRRL_B-16638]MDX3347998.1 hypothetical protein [Streptomyces sp. ME02-6979A]MDX3410643.1 hypothetical protein [Streptomyces sp. ME02-6977A]MYU45644.1 hypothetical protein [Streptomyces sp. SID7813]
MIRHVRVLPVLVLAPLLLTACGSEKAGDPGPSASASAPASAAGPAAAPGTGELASRAQAMGVAPELVYVTEAPGFTLAQQSVGVLGDEGFSATWVDGGTNALLRLAVDRGTITVGTCPEQPVGDMPGEHTTCERDGKAWYRTGAGRHEYALPEEGHVVRVSAEQDAVPRDVLRAAALAAHRPDAAETDRLLPSAEPAPATPVERGDLPPFGDGAPDNHVDVGG